MASALVSTRRTRMRVRSGDQVERERRPLALAEGRYVAVSGNGEPLLALAGLACIPGVHVDVGSAAVQDGTLSLTSSLSVRSIRITCSGASRAPRPLGGPLRPHLVAAPASSCGVVIAAASAGTTATQPTW